MTRLGIVGGGNMGELLVAGILKAKLLEPSRLMVSDVRDERLQHLAGKYKVKTTRDNLEIVRECESVLLAVKPQNVKDVLDEMSDALGSHQLLISIAAGIPLRTIEGKLSRPVPVVRVMPNTPAQVQEVAAGISLGSHASSSHRDMVVKMFNAIGVAVVVDEKLMDSVTAVSGSGPAYVFLLAQTLIEAGVTEGLTPDVARELAIQTLYGASLMLSQTMEDPAVLRKQVTSPGGTTEAAVKILEDRGWSRILAEAVHAARVRSEELAQMA